MAPSCHHLKIVARRVRHLRQRSCFSSTMRRVMRPKPRFARAAFADGFGIASVLGGEFSISPQAIGVDAPVIERRADRTAGLRFMPAVCEAACRVSSAMSEKTSSIPSSASVSCSSRIPGVSSSHPPAFSRCSEPEIQDWRRYSSSETPSSAFTKRRTC